MYYVDIAYIDFFSIIFNTVNYCDPFCLAHRSVHNTLYNTLYYENIKVQCLQSQIKSKSSQNS